MLPNVQKYRVARAFLKALRTREVSRAGVRELEKALDAAMGKVGAFRDWKEPDEWIEVRLKGKARDVARAVWLGSDKVVNPRYIWRVRKFVEKKGLVEVTPAGVYKLNRRGEDFYSNPFGETVRELDREEGLIKILQIHKEKGPIARKDILPYWCVYIKEFAPEWKGREGYLLNKRVGNLQDRGLLERAGLRNQITPAGEEYLASFDKKSLGPPPRPAATIEGKRPGKRAAKSKDTAHDIAQLRLIELAKAMGYEVYVARSDKSKVVKGVRFSALAMTDLPAKGLSQELKKRMANIDVIWFEPQTFMPKAFIEIETTTGFARNLSKINDLLAEIPPGFASSAGVYIFGYEKDRAEAESFMFGPTFTSLEDRCREYKFITLEELKNKYDALMPSLQREHGRLKKYEEQIERCKARILRIANEKFGLFSLG